MKDIPRVIYFDTEILENCAMLLKQSDDRKRFGGRSYKSLNMGTYGHCFRSIYYHPLQQHTQIFFFKIKMMTVIRHVLQR